MSDFLYFLEVEALGASANITLGGIPIFVHLDGAPRVLRRAVGAELVVGSNTLVAEIAAPPGWLPPPTLAPVPAEEDDDPPQVRVALFRVEKGKPQMDTDVIVEASWTRELCSLPTLGVLPLVRHRFGSRGAPGGSPWAADDIARDEDRPAIVAFIIELRQALAERNVGRALELMAGQTHGRAEADGVDGDAAAEDLALELELLFEDEAFELLPITLADLTLDRLRDGRITRVGGGPRGEPAIMARVKRGFWHRAPIVSMRSGKVTMWT